MRCSKCQLVLDHRGVVITDVTEGGTYTATLHPHCLNEVIGVAPARRLISLAFSSGWVQTGLPLLYDRK